MRTARHLLLAGALLLAGGLAMPAQAQTDDDTAPAVKAPSLPPSELQFHHHGGGDDGDAFRPSLRQEGNPDNVLRKSAGTGLGLDQAMLPGELGPAPERQQPLFAKPNDGLAQQRDPWDTTVK